MTTTTNAEPQTDAGSDKKQLPVAEGVLSEKTDEQIILDVPHTDYKFHLKPVGDINVNVGDDIAGIIRANALKVITINAGGRYIEPAWGRPRRVQGVITGGNVEKNQVYLNAGVPVVVTLIDAQKASDFSIGQMLSFDVKAGSTFEQV